MLLVNALVKSLRTDEKFFSEIINGRKLDDIAIILTIR